MRSLLKCLMVIGSLKSGEAWEAIEVRSRNLPIGLVHLVPSSGGTSGSRSRLGCGGDGPPSCPALPQVVKAREKRISSRVGFLRGLVELPNVPRRMIGVGRRWQRDDSQRTPEAHQD